MPRESKFQADLIKSIKLMFVNSIVLKNDSSYQGGIPDLLILVGDRWATLECKKSADASVQPNQPYFVDLMDQMSFSAFVFPENRDHVLEALHHHFTR